MYNLPSPALLSRLGLIFLILGLIVVIGAFYVIHTSLTFNPIRLPFEKQIQIGLFMPQGWGFFTRDPQESQYTFFQQRSGQWRAVLNKANANWTNSFGWSRESDALDAEWYQLLSDVNKKLEWVSCKKNVILENCFAKTQPIVTINHHHKAHWCGTLGVMSNKPVPWAWAQSRKTIVMPRQVITLRAIC